MSGDLKTYQAAKDRVERFRGGGLIWHIWGSDYPSIDERLKAFRADLNTIAAYEAGQVEKMRPWTSLDDGPVHSMPAQHFAPQVPQIDARTYLMGCALTGLLAAYPEAMNKTRADCGIIDGTIAYADAALSALKVNHD